MKKTITFSALILSFLFSINATSQWNYPPSLKSDSIEVYFGDTIRDSYQWLENLKDPVVEKWFKDEAEYTKDVLSKIPNKQTLVDEMSALDKIKSIKYSSITERNGVYFFTKRLPGQEIGKLFYRVGKDGQDVLLFDVEKYQEGKTYTLSSWIVSDNGNMIMLGITEKGKEIPFIKIMDAETKNIYPLQIDNAYSSGWLKNSDDTFMYLKLKGGDVHEMESKMNSEVYIHKLGDEVSNDRLVLSKENDPSLNIKSEEYPYIAWYDNSNYMIAGKSSVDNNQEYYYAPYSQLLQTDKKIDWKLLCTKEDEIQTFVADKDKIYFLTTKNASNFKITETDLKNPDAANANTIFEGNDKKIESIKATKDYLIIEQIYNGIETYVTKMNFEDGITKSVDLPLKGNTGLTPLSSFNNDCIVWNSNWTTPSNFYLLNIENDNFEKGPFYVEYEISGIDNIVSEEIEIPSHDGTMVPLSIIYDKTKFKKDGSNICFMEGYGAYGISSSPYFNTYMFPMLQRGMVYAVAHVRGGSEKGEEWYRAGQKTTKPNTWKDFIACAQYLVDNNYTSKERLAGSGTSAGGIMIGRAMTERPDLFKVAIPKVGCLNTIRGEFSPNGPVNIPEFGTVTIEEEYYALKEMDSYEHIVKGEKYPATLITTGYNDPRVISWIPGKFAARLQEYNASDNPVLLDVDYSTGHFGGETMTDYFKTLAGMYSFIMWQCGNPDFQPAN
jgi:prolyl oligopeptidase